MEYGNEYTTLGTNLKYKLEIEAEGFSMDTDGFEVDITCGMKSQHFDKENLETDDQGNWYVCFDTQALGPGRLFATVTAYVPDDDYPDGLRREVERLELIPVRA